LIKNEVNRLPLASDELQEHIKGQIEENLGMPMAFTIGKERNSFGPLPSNYYLCCVVNLCKKVYSTGYLKKIIARQPCMRVKSRKTPNSDKYLPVTTVL
jgi:hypothetical protein